MRNEGPSMTRVITITWIWQRKLLMGCLATTAVAVMASCSAAGTLESSDYNFADFLLAYDTAHSNAVEWHATPIMTRADIRFAPRHAAAEAPAASFFFINPSNHQEWLLVRVQPVAEGEYRVTASEAGRYEDPKVNAIGIKPETLRLNPELVLSIALLGPVPIRSDVLENAIWPASIVLQREDLFNVTGEVIWSVQVSGGIAGESQSVKVNDASGQVVGASTDL